MVDYTRRTHIVRVNMGDAPAEGKQPAKYIDIEVLDAIAFRIDGGKEVILDMKTSNSEPKIVDAIGGGHGRSPENAATQRTRMTRIGTGDNQIDVEVLEAMAFRDQNGQEWILDMQRGKGNFYDVTDHTGDKLSTRRLHDEKVYVGKKPDPAKAASNKRYLTCQRNDAMAFRTINGREVVFTCKSYDDGNGTRATTFLSSPRNYNPDDDKGPIPPLNKDPHDPHVYAASVSGAKSFLTAAEKINFGPFWWIRKIHVPGGIGVLVYSYQYFHNHFSEPNVEELDIPGHEGIHLFQVGFEGADGTNTLPLKLKLGDKDTDVVDPVSDDMLTDLLAWAPASFHEAVRGVDTSKFDGTAVVFFNLTEMASAGDWPITIAVPAMPAGSSTLPGSTTYYVWFNSGDPFPGPFPDPNMDISCKTFIGNFILTPDGNGLIFTGNPSDIIFSSAWAGNLTLAEAVIALPGLVGSWHIESQTGPPIVVPDTSRYDWSATLLTYDTRLDFPIGDKDVPAWTIDDGLISRLDFSGRKISAESGSVVSFSVDDDLKVTGSVTP